MSRLGKENSKSSLSSHKLMTRVLSSIGFPSAVQTSQDKEPLLEIQNKKSRQKDVSNGRRAAVELEISRSALEKQVAFLTPAEPEAPQPHISCTKEKSEEDPASCSPPMMPASSVKKEVPSGDLAAIADLMEDVLSRIPVQNETATALDETLVNPNSLEGEKKVPEVQLASSLALDRESVEEEKELSDKLEACSTGTDLDTSSEFVDAESEFLAENESLDNRQISADEAGFHSFNTSGTESFPSDEVAPDSIETPNTPIAAPRFSEDSSDVDTPRVEEKCLPITKGTYNIDWDNFDESAIDPFNTGNKIRTTDILGNYNNAMGEDVNANEQLEAPSGQRGTDPVGNEPPVPPHRKSSGTKAQKTPPPQQQQEHTNSPNLAAVGGKTDLQSVIASNQPEQMKSENQTAMVAPLAKKSGNSSQLETDGSSVTEREKERLLEGSDPDPDNQFVMGNPEMFGDPGDLEFLQNKGAGNAADSELYRESLYVKFDPLVKRTQEQTGIPEPKIPEENLLLSMQTPSPAQQNSSKSKSESQSPPPTVVRRSQNKGKNEKEMDPLLDVDRLLAMNPPNQVEGSPSYVDSMFRNMLDNAINDVKAPGNESQMDMLAHKLKLQFQAVLLAKEREWSSELDKQKRKSEKLAEDLKVARDESESARQQSSEMSLVVSEYEKTIGQLMSDRDATRRDRSGDYESILRERDQAFDDLQAVENSFADLHRRYEKLRGSTEDFKKNEESLKKMVQDCKAKLKRADEKFQKLREHAEEKLEKANLEIEKLNKAKETDTLALRAQLKKRDLQVETLEKSLETKQKEIAELTAICDELIQKAGLQQQA